MSLPTTLVTINLAVLAVPTRLLPTVGNIPLIFVNVSLTVAIWLIVTLTYLTLAGGWGGSAKTIESPSILNAVSGVCTTPVSYTHLRAHET